MEAGRHAIFVRVQKNYLSANEINALKEGLSSKAGVKQRIIADRILNRLGFMRVSENGSRLNEEEWRTIVEGLAKGASEEDQKKAEKILIQIVGLRAKAPTGPKKKSTTNPVDEELRRLFNTIRSVMSVDVDLPKSEILNFVRHMLWIGHDLLRRNLFFKKEELDAIKIEYNRLAFLPPDPIVKSFLKFLKELIWFSLTKIHDDIRFNDIREGARIEIKRRRAISPKNSNASLEDSEKQIYADIAHSLRIGIANSDIPSRAKILKTAISRLYHFRNLFDGALVAMSANDAAPMYRILRDAPWINAPEPLSQHVGRISDIFLTVCRRQGIYPFQGETIEDIDFEPVNPTDEGEISTGG